MNHHARFCAALAAIVALPFVFQGAAAMPPSGPSMAMSWSPAYPIPNQDVTFSIDTQDSDGSIQSVTVTFGDGGSQTMNAPRSVISDTKACVLGAHQTFTMTHSFGQTGNYPLAIEVRSSPCPVTATFDSTSSTAHYSIHVHDPGTTAQLNAPNR